MNPTIDTRSKEFVGELVSYKLNFTSSELVLPSSELYVVVARFQFFYWLYYYHYCCTNSAHTDWSPDPRLIRGYYTFKPSAAMAPEKVQAVVEEIAQIAVQSIGVWCDQSRAHFEKRVEVLNKAKTLIS